MAVDFLVGAVRETAHRGNDDLVSAGLGLAGLRGMPAEFADPEAPTPAELRRRAIQMAWKGIADLGPLGRFGDLYGGATFIPGREYQAFARLPEARSSHRVLVQVPDNFSMRARCVIVCASSGSRGIYGSISVTGAWGLPRGCAVAYTDKGAGQGWFDCAEGSGVSLDGIRARAGEAELEFAVDNANADAGIATKHAHSGDNPEAHWGEHVLQAAQFALAMLDGALPQHAPFTRENTRILAVGISNGGAAVLQAAGFDTREWIDGIVAIEPNINPPPSAGARARPLYDYASNAALFMPCALLAPRFDNLPLMRFPGNNIATWQFRGETLRNARLIAAGESRAQAAEALDCLHADGWTDAALAAAASTTAFDMWRSFQVTYASSYLRSGPAMPFGFRFDMLDAAGRPRAATRAERALWWCDSGGIVPGAGVMVHEPPGDGTAEDPAWARLAKLRALWSSNDTAAQQLHLSVRATQAQLPRADLPIFILHGADDGLIPAVFSSDAYVHWLRAKQRQVHYWKLPHVQHFDAFLALPGFGDRYVPMMPFAYAAMEQMYRHVVDGAPLDPGPAPVVAPRGAVALEAARLGLQT